MGGTHIPGEAKKKRLRTSVGMGPFWGEGGTGGSDRRKKRRPPK